MPTLSCYTYVAQLFSTELAGKLLKGELQALATCACATETSQILSGILWLFFGYNNGSSDVSAILLMVSC